MAERKPLRVRFLMGFKIVLTSEEQEEIGLGAVGRLLHAAKELASKDLPSLDVSLLRDMAVVMEDMAQI